MVPEPPAFPAPSLRKKLAAWGAVLLAALLVVMIAAALFVRPRLPAAERGRRLAERTGCFGCHGPEGTRGTSNPGRRDESVPTFTGDLMMYAETEEDVREWIRDGVTRKRAASETWQRESESGVLKMPAFGDRLSERQIDELVAFVLAAWGELPHDSLAARGLERAEALGCTGCHGAGGRLARPNPGSLKGYVPSWDGADFPELVRDRAEFDEWVRRGVSRRFENNPLASFFLERAVLKMPPYEDRLGPGDLDALWAYVRWVRGSEKGATP